MLLFQRARPVVGLPHSGSRKRDSRACPVVDVARFVVLVAILGSCAAGRASGQEPVQLDSTAGQAPDTTGPPAPPADTTGPTVAPADSTIVPAAPDTDRTGAPEPTDSTTTEAADSTRAVEADSAIAVEADSAEAAAADTLERVRSDIAKTRARLDEVKQTLETIPEEDRLRYSPRGAVLRAFALPGWGQFYTGHTVRGFLYGGAEVTFGTLGFLQQKEVLDLRDDIFQAKLDFVAADQELHPDSAYSKEDTLELYDRFEGTVEGLTLEAELHDKQKSREDFFTYAIFSVLFSAIDAFVSAHLEPFDTAKLDVRPAGGGWRIDVRLPFGRDPATAAPKPAEAIRSGETGDP